MRYILVLPLIGLLTGCAGLEFHATPQDDALSFFEPVPYLFVAINKDCTESATLITLPGKERSVSLRSGYGSADLSVAIKDGMITNVGQKTDTQIPQTITAITGAIKAGVGALVAQDPKGCGGGALYRLEHGHPVEKIKLP